MLCGSMTISPLGCSLSSLCFCRETRFCEKHQH
uniref:Uncharacterized protein n=1 Tax=Rhizophora mucronata TaxID=61149 RepID=A0A2P2QMC5_RHIMU